MIETQYWRKQWKRLIQTTSCCFSATVPLVLNYVAIQIYFEPKPFPHSNAMANRTLCHPGCSISIAIANICVGFTIYTVLLCYLILTTALWAGTIIFLMLHTIISYHFLLGTDIPSCSLSSFYLDISIINANKLVLSPWHGTFHKLANRKACFLSFSTFGSLL